MTPPGDQQLVGEYAARASEGAFRSLVQRHVDLVYATAMRQLGDRGMAEEVTQNVFVALARKAPRLTGVQTLAGWLHRTTILEAKARIRAELRRRRRENAAAEIATLGAEGSSPLASLIPLLDEGLLNLAESDRLALVLRFLEEQSLREVGQALGIDEDAARKRVSRALSRLASFFRQRGLAVPGTAGVAAVLTSSTQAAPTALTAVVTQAGLAAGSAATGLNLVLFQIMTLSKLQTAALCVVIAAAPLVWQRRAEARVTRTRHALGNQITEANQKADALDAQLRQTRETVLRTEADTLNARRGTDTLIAQRQGQTERPAYGWDDNSPYVRVPKRLLEAVDVNAAANKRGQLSEQIKELLQLTGPEVERTQAALDQFVADYRTVQAAKVRSTIPTAKEIDDGNPDDVRAFEVQAVPERLGELRQTLFTELQGALGAERFELFRRALRNWMPVDDEDRGVNSGMAVLNFDHRELFFKPNPGDRWFRWGLEAPGTCMRASMALDDIPPIYRAQFPDWIALALSQPERP